MDNRVRLSTAGISGVRKVEPARYPTDWGTWVPDAERNCDVRYRLKSPDEYEYEYGPIKPSNGGGTPEDSSVVQLPKGTHSVANRNLFTKYHLSDPSDNRDFEKSKLDVTYTPGSAVANASPDRYQHYVASDFMFGQVRRSLTCSGAVTKMWKVFELLSDLRRHVVVETFPTRCLCL
jgi:hypothetical protein